MNPALALAAVTVGFARADSYAVVGICGAVGMLLYRDDPWRSPIGFVVGSALLGFGNSCGSAIIMTLGADLAPNKNKARFLKIWQEIVALGRRANHLLFRN